MTETVTASSKEAIAVVNFQAILSSCNQQSAGAPQSLIVVVQLWQESARWVNEHLEQALQFETPGLRVRSVCHWGNTTLFLDVERTLGQDFSLHDIRVSILRKIGGFTEALHLVEARNAFGLVKALETSEVSGEEYLFCLATGIDIRQVGCLRSEVGAGSANTMLAKDGQDWSSTTTLNFADERRFEYLLSRLEESNEYLDPAIWRQKEFKGFIHRTSSCAASHVEYMPSGHRGEITSARFSAFSANLMDTLKAISGIPA